WGGWRLHEAVAALDAPILVVGIDATADRLSDYAHTDDVIGETLYTGRGTDYARLVQLDVRPHIEAHYPTDGVDALLGSSMGGLASLVVAHIYPGEFELVASLSGTLGWGRFGAENPTIQSLYEAA